MEPSQDELIARIIAAAESHGVNVDTRVGGYGVQLAPGGYIPNKPQGPVCAVGAGVLYRSVKTDGRCDPLAAFSSSHAVSIEYAIGVSDGFESDSDATVGDERDDLFDDCDYHLGWAVGEAVRAYFEDAQ